MQYKKDEYFLIDDKQKVDINKVHKMLSKTYWASERSLESFKIAIDNSICFSIFYKNEQVGFARVVTDESVFSWICDVIIDENFRGKGLGKWLMECVINHPKVVKTPQHLGTLDAHGLYEKYGFKRIETMRRVLK